MARSRKGYARANSRTSKRFDKANNYTPEIVTLGKAASSQSTNLADWLIKTRAGPLLEPAHDISRMIVPDT
jgi:hypothetical protein